MEYTVINVNRLNILIYIIVHLDLECKNPIHTSFPRNQMF